MSLFNWNIKELVFKRFILKAIVAHLVCVCIYAQDANLAQSPPLGWNSFDSYGVYLHEKAATENLEAFIEKLAPHGYEYFVIDAGWFGEFELVEGTLYPKEKHAKKVNINEFGLLQPSNTYFPNGLQAIIDRCHEHGLKFGIHLMRGIPRAAVEANTPVKGTNYFARDIADTNSICVWNHQNYGVDMDKPGAQEFYNSLINQMAEWGVDLLKYDDLVPFPKEVEAVTNAIAQSGRPILLSLSPGDHVHDDAIDFYKRGNMLRVTPDIWDQQKGIDQCFVAWRKWNNHEESGFWIDMDMIPFGQLQLMNPLPAGLTGQETKSEIYQGKSNGLFTNVELLAGVGWTRKSNFSEDQMYTFITMRALAASPLMVGGDLPTMDDFSLELLTHPDMLECNQNGIMGDLVFDKDKVEIWNTPARDGNGGWIGIFNRSEAKQKLSLSKVDLNLADAVSYKISDIWGNKDVDTLKFKINPNGVVFLKYTGN